VPLLPAPADCTAAAAAVNLEPGGVAPGRWLQ
jgi:hypothetical protein